jgi:hypothetical protein
MKLSGFLAATMAVASAALLGKEPQLPCGDNSPITPTVVTDVTVPVILPVPGSTAIIFGNITLVTFSNGTLILKKWLPFPSPSAAAVSGFDINSSGSMGLSQQDATLNMVPLDPEADIDIGTSVIDVTINGVNGNTAVDIFF